MEMMKTVPTNSQNGVEFYRGILPNVYTSFNKIEKYGNPKPAHPASLFFPSETTKKALVHILAPHSLRLLTFPGCITGCCHPHPVAWGAAFFWVLWVKNYLVNDSHLLIGWSCQTWIIIKPIFLKQKYCYKYCMQKRDRKLLKIETKRQKQRPPTYHPGEGKPLEGARQEF